MKKCLRTNRSSVPSLAKDGAGYEIKKHKPLPNPTSWMGCFLGGFTKRYPKKTTCHTTSTNDPFLFIHVGASQFRVKISRQKKRIQGCSIASGLVPWNIRNLSANATVDPDVMSTISLSHRDPMGWTGYLPTYMKTKKKNIHVGKYTSPMDPMGFILHVGPACLDFVYHRIF